MSQTKCRRLKPSGIHWIGDIPEDWFVAPIRLVAQLESGHTPSRSNPEYWQNCDVAWFTLADVGQIRDGLTECVFETKEKISELGLANSAARRLPPETVILSRTASVGFSAMLGMEMATSQDFANWICGSRLMPRFLLKVFRAMRSEFERLRMGSTHNTIYMPDIRSMRMPLPPVDEQHAIVTFLDRETAKIDALVAEQRRLIALLREKRQAVISHAVTKGLNPDAPMKPTGIEWLGDVPAHWEVSRLKWVAKMESGHTPDKKIGKYWENCHIPWVSLNDTKHLRDHEYISETAYQINELGIANSSARLLPPRAVVFSRDATIGRCAITTQEMAVSQHFIAWICGDDVIPEYLLFCLRTMQQELERLTAGATLKTIGMPDVKTLAAPIPPRREQSMIVAWVTEQACEVDAFIAEAEQAVELLQERRTVLISVAVTGKIDVREQATEEAA